MSRLKSIVRRNRVELRNAASAQWSETHSYSDKDAGGSAYTSTYIRETDARFMTVSGDLIADGFSCRYTTLFPGSTPGDYQPFVLKAMSFVLEELRASFPGMPV